MKVLVTGGAGFIGSHVVEELLKYHYQIVVVDNLITGFIHNIPEEVVLYNLDINDSELETVFKEERPDYVIHLAAQSSVPTSMTNPYLDFDTNTVGTIKILLLSIKYNVSRLIFASTAAVYGEPTYLPIDEKHPIHAKSFYSLSKYTAEKYIKLFGIHKEYNHCILRFSNVFGPRQNTNGEAGVISIFINRILERKNVVIFDGSQTRDFIYVKDVAAACRLAVEGEQTGIFNISSCTETSIDNLYTQLTNKLGINIAPIYERMKVGEIKNSILDNQKAQHDLNWEVKYSFSEGLEETLQYYSSQFMYNFNR